MSLAFVFPGQGSQFVGMLGSIKNDYPKLGEIVTQTFQQASDVLQFDLWEMCQQGPEDVLNKTWNTQPAMLAAGFALWQIWLERGGARPVIMAGHSLGEYTALVCAESINFKDAIDLVHTRGKLMQEAVAEGEGAMAAILGLADEDVIAVCNKVSEQMPERIVSAANFNSPGQVVIAGHSDAIDAAIKAASAAGAKKAIKLAVSVPSHCKLMQKAAASLGAKLNLIEIERPVIPVINNVHVTVENDDDLIRDALVRQLYSPVRWVETIEKMHRENVTQLVECGPGKVLAGLNKRINKEMKTSSMCDIDSLEQTIEELGK